MKKKEHSCCDQTNKYLRLHTKDPYLNILSDAGTISLFIEYCPWCGEKLT